VFDPVATGQEIGAMASVMGSEKIATGIATGLLTTRRHGPAHPGNASIEMSNEIGLANTRQNALGRLQRFPKAKAGRTSLPTYDREPNLTARFADTSRTRICTRWDEIDCSR
jgi:hypothetical protein